LNSVSLGRESICRVRC